MLKKIFVLVFVILCFFSSFVSAEVFNGKEYGFSVNVPTGWKVESKLPTYMISNQEKDAKIGIHFLSGIPQGHSCEENIFKLMRISETVIKATNATVIEQRKPITIAKQIGFQTIASIPRKDGVMTKTSVTVFCYNDKICFIICSSRIANYNEMSAVFQNTLTSLNFSNMSAFEWYMKGFNYQKAKSNEKAVESFSKALELEPMNTEYIQQIAYTYSEMRKFDQAIVEISKAIEMKPNDPTYYSERAYAHVNNKNGQAALEDFEKAIQLDPKRAYYYAGRGNAYALLGKYTEAIEDFNKEMSIEGQTVQIFFNLAQCYEFMGNKEEALKYYKIVLGYSGIPNEVKRKAVSRVNNDWELFREWI